jgi:hypothetical protein
MDRREKGANPRSCEADPFVVRRENAAMPSPFPGMNPYLEQDDVWHDFHERFIPLVATLLGGQLRPRYIVKIDEHIFVHELIDAQLDLQAVLDRIYDDAGYGDYIYEGNPHPRLASDDAVWARQRIGDREVQL